MSRVDWPRQIAGVSLAGLMAGCAMAPTEPPQEPVDPATETTQPSAQTTDYEAQIADLRDRISQLEYTNRQFREELAASELKTIASNTQLAQLRERYRRLSRAHDDAVSEVVRSQAKLQGSVSQADAAANMAEAELALSQSEEAGSDIEQARSLLASASAQFDQGNYGGALYLSNQSKRVLANAQTSETMLAPVEDETLFADMLNMWVTLNSNLRSGPGMDFGVITVVEEGTAVRAYSFSDAWVRVVLGDGRDGWVFKALVSQSPPQPPSS